MSSKIVVVTGGARSGKSTFAERYAAALTNRIAYIATAQIYDDEMQRRVDMHRQRRPATWCTVEAPYEAHLAIKQLPGQVQVVLFDCLTLYTTNLLLNPNAPADPEQRYQFIMNDIHKLVAAARASGLTVIFVTNEVGNGIVPENALAREYRDVAGLVNQYVAAQADEVYLVVCGIAAELKKLGVQLATAREQND